MSRKLTILAIALISISMTQSVAAANGTSPAEAGEIVSVSGTVFVRPDGRAASTKLAPAKAGDLVRAGDVINSASDGKVKILFKDKTIIDLGPSALFKVDQYKANQGANREVAVNMVYGSVRAAVSQKLEGKGKFKLRTPSAVMGVRGTEFIVKSDQPADLKQTAAAISNPDKPAVAPAQASEAKTQVTVVQGRVDVAPKVAAIEGRSPASVEKPVVLTAGTQLTTQASASAPAQAVKVDPTQMAQLRETVKVQDNTFQKAVVVEAVSANGGSAGGDATRAAVATAVASNLTLAPPNAIGAGGFAGTFGNNQTFQPMNVNFLQAAGQLKTLTVRVVAP